LRRILRALAVLLTAAACYAAVQAASIWRYGAVDETRPANVAIVLGAGTFNGEVSPVYQARIDHGVWLYENGYVEKLILTGGYVAGSSVSDAAAAGQYAVSVGMPEADILLEERSAITQENLAYAGEIMADGGYETALVVSDPLHMKRAMLLAKDAGIEAYSSPTPTSRYRSLKTKMRFLAREVFYYIGYQVYRLVT
jgi:uncharacterized SAM-binding protein YcdF (DUF218 family)